MDIVRLTREAAEIPPGLIALSLRNFIGDFMDDNLFEAGLLREKLYRNPGVARILIAVEEKERIAFEKPALSLTELVALAKAGHTIEHILPQEPSFEMRGYGFPSDEAYVNYVHRLGNLTLLESRLNSACNNQTVETKMSDGRLYPASSYQMTRSLAASRANRTPVFSRTDINIRGAELAQFCVKEWPLW